MNANQRFHFGRAQVHFQRGDTSHALRHLHLSGGGTRFGDDDPVAVDTARLDQSRDDDRYDDVLPVVPEPAVIYNEEEHKEDPTAEGPTAFGRRKRSCPTCKR